MTTFTSKQTTITRSAGYVFRFLSDFNNFGKLLPPQVTEWECDSESCSFNIQNMAKLELRYEVKQPNSHIKMVSEGKSPFSFDVQCYIADTSDQTCEVQLELNAKLNPMIKMMASRPLANFIDILAEKLKETCEEQPV